jgi:hypothetical protein
MSGSDCPDRSHPVEGTTFVFTLPAVAEEADA